MAQNVHLWAICSIVVFACCGPQQAERSRPERVVDAALPVTPTPEKPSTRDELFHLYHLQWVSGDLSRVRRELGRLLEDTRGPVWQRARAALRLAGIAENTGRRREALTYLEQVSALTGHDHPLARRAADWSQRIRGAVPLAAVRGPVPGTVVLRSERSVVNTAFRRAEKRLVVFFRVIVAPRLENIDEVLRNKRRALKRALAAYRKVAENGGPLAQAVSHYRMAAMCHHFAEALAFERPDGLLPSVAKELNHKLGVQSTSFLRRALSHYNTAARVKGVTGGNRWRTLALREARTLRAVLRGPKRGR